MIKKHYNKSLSWIEHRRFQLLLLATALVLILPAFAVSGMLSDIITVITMTFLFIQSTIAADLTKKRKARLRIIAIALIAITWLQPAGIDYHIIEIVKLISISLFFGFVLFYLLRFIRLSKLVTMDVLVTSVNVYLLIGITAASLSFLFYKLYPGAYHFPTNITTPIFVNFLYYTFITMTTVGYGDITPCLPQTQTLAFLISVTGQLYVAIIIAFLVGKFIVHADHEKAVKKSHSDE